VDSLTAEPCPVLGGHLAPYAWQQTAKRDGGELAWKHAFGNLTLEGWRSQTGKGGMVND